MGELRFFRNLDLTAAGFAALAVLSLCPSRAQAQIPSSVEPDFVTRELEEGAPLASHPPHVDIVTPGPEESDKMESQSQKAFVLSAIVLDDATIYKNSDFSAVSARYAGKEVSFQDLNAIAGEMTRRYRKDGYILSRVIVPPQDVTEGIVHFRAVEGHLSGVELVGNDKSPDQSGLIARMADKIKSSGPVNARVLERYLLLIDDLPGITARGLIRAGVDPGSSELVISIEEEKAEGSVSLDNRGSRFLGPFRGQLVGAFNNFLGLRDRTTLRGITTAQSSELQFFDVTHEEQLGADGARIRARATITGTAPGGRISNLDIKGDSRQLEIESVYPLFRSRSMNFDMIGGVSAQDSRTRLAGIEVARDRVRYITGGGHLDFTDGLRGVNQFDFDVAKGLGILNPTSDGIGRSRANGHHDFLRATLTASRVQDLGRAFSMLLSGSGQTSSAPLLASQEFTAGGGDFGRAYDAGEIAGDNGIAAGLELRYSLFPDGDYLRSYQFYGFYDAARVFNEAPVAGESKTDSLASAGVGARFNMARDISGYVELGIPLTRDVNSEGDNETRIFFSLLKRLSYKP